MIDTNNVYIYCSLFILFDTSILLTKIYLEVILAKKTAVIVNNCLNYCRYNDNNSHF